MMRQQLWSTLGDFCELVFEGFGDTGMQRASRLPQQGDISGILH
jgi:hypothetical protein